MAPRAPLQFRTDNARPPAWVRPRAEGLRMNLPMSQRIKGRIARRIDRSRDAVFLRPDFRNIGSYTQVGRALTALVRDGKLLPVI